MKRKILAVALAFALAFSCTGCMDDVEEIVDEIAEEDYDEDVKDDGADDSASGKTSADDTSGGNQGTKGVKGLSIKVDRSTGKLNIERAEARADAPVGDEGVWTVFVYLCGTDLESGGGMGTGDLAEMIDAATGENVRFIVETGGAAEWCNEVMDPNKLQRYIVSDGDMELVDETAVSGMGRPDTLADFLTWGVENYCSEHMGVIIWNHGGGSITGVCFDETDDYKSMTIKEMDDAFYACLTSSGRKFDFIGFDACLMGTIECANVMATYADYMYGSQETEPGSGWDYTAIGSFLGQNNDDDGSGLGKVVSDSFLAACEAVNDSDLTTLSVIDLSKMDDLIISFNDFAKGLYESGQDQSNLTEMIRGITAADNFGGNNKSEGYTNMVDLGDIISACDTYADGADAALKALDAAVFYKISGPVHKKASGLSMYYPLSIQGSNELGIFSDVCTSPYYLAFVDRNNQSGAGILPETEEYDDSSLYDEEGEWNWGETEDDSYWDYMDDYEATGESQYITFAQEPFINDNGYYSFELDDDGYDYTSAVSALVYEITEDGDAMMELGETTDVYCDWDTGIFEDNFDGYWLSLPDGQNIATYIVEETEDCVIYTTPVMLNGEDTNLRLKQSYDDDSVTVEGAWDGIDENGCAARNIVKIKDGDVIVPLYYAYDLETDEEFQYEGLEFEVSGSLEINYELIDVGEFLYAFCIDDIYGDYYVSDPIMFEVDEDGEVTFVE